MLWQMSRQKKKQTNMTFAAMPPFCLLSNSFSLDLDSHLQKVGVFTILFLCCIQYSGVLLLLCLWQYDNLLLK